MLATLAFLCSFACYAEDFHLIELDTVALDYKNYSVISDKQRNLLLYPESPKESINVILNTTLFKYAYFNNTIESLTTNSQYRGIGLQLALGVRLSQYLDIGYYHHSQHVMDREMQSIPTFPTEDTLELKFYLYRNDKNAGIF